MSDYMKMGMIPDLFWAENRMYLGNDDIQPIDTVIHGVRGYMAIFFHVSG